MKKSVFILLLLFTAQVAISQIGISKTKDQLSQEAYSKIVQANEKITTATKNVDKNFIDVSGIIKKELDELTHFTWELKREQRNIHDFITVKSVNNIKEKYRNNEENGISSDDATAMAYKLFKLKKEKENIKMYLSIDNKATEEAKRIYLVLCSIEKVIKTTIQ